MNDIPEKFTKHGLHFTLIDQEGDFAIYKITKQGWTKLPIYKVMTQDDSEAWTFTSLQSAYLKMDEVSNMHIDTQQSHCTNEEHKPFEIGRVVSRPHEIDK